MEALALTVANYRNVARVTDIMHQIVVGRKQLNLPERYGRGSWVFITGASYGIGLQFALDFAKLGFNLILLSRSLSNLNEAKEEILRQYNVQIRLLTHDLSKKLTREDYASIVSQVADLDISVLVNNVGINIKGTISEISRSKIDVMLNLNVVACTWLSQLFIPRFLEREKRSALIVVSSYVWKVPYFISPMYASTKRYEYSAFLAASKEHKDKIDYQISWPAYVFTPTAAKNVNKNFTIVTTEEFVANCMKSVGRETLT